MPDYENDPSFQRAPTDSELLMSMSFCQLIERTQNVELEKSLSEGKSLRDLVREGQLLSEQQLESVQVGTRLVNAGLITMAQLCIALYDERTIGMRMTESLRERGWMPQ
jgi:hypothetical protein